MAKKRDWRKHKYSVTAIRDVYTNRGVIPQGTSVKLHSPQLSRNDDIRVYWGGRWHCIDHIDFNIPNEATDHLPNRKPVFAQGLETI